METTVKCPHCGNKFSPEVALEHDIRLQMEKEFADKMNEQAKTVEQRVKRLEEEKYQSRIRAIEADREHKLARLLELEEKALGIEERERMLHEREEKGEMELRRRLLEREKLMREEADRKATEKVNLEMREKQMELDREKERLNMIYKKTLSENVEKAREEERMRFAELQMKLDDQSKLINEMKRKSEQGSMQSQGEVQELALEEFLRHNFGRDQIEEVAKGKRGGDCIHHVIDAYGNRCGNILYESKRTKNFSHDWTTKLKDDMRLTQADIGVIVTETLPADLTHFGLHDGVWVCTFTEFKALASLFRESLCRVGEVKIAQENKGDKMQLLYDYLTSIEFKQKIEAIVESFQQMQDDLTKEKAQTISRWAKREKQIFKVLENTVGLYGDVRGIAGNAVKEIEALEYGGVQMLIDR